MVCDPFWKESFRAGDMIDECICKGYKAILIKGASSQSNFKYPYRIFFFQKDSSAPFLILSLEIGLRFGTCALGAHTASEHINYGPADPEMSLDDFRSWAMSTVEKNFF
jgi:hypothetical protein